jgi:uncharacterized protein with PIN domain
MQNGAENRIITIILSKGLQALLRAGFKNDPIEYELNRRASIKDIVESIGIPHTEIGSIRVKSQLMAFGFIPKPGQKIHVAEIDAPFDVTQPSLLRPDPIQAVRFIVDVNVGRLAALLRLAGFDTTYENGMDDAQIAALADTEKRIVLTRDRALLKRNQVLFGRLVRAVKPDEQLVEALHFFGLSGPFRLFSRCLLCNRPLEPVEKTAIVHRLEPKTKKYFDTFKTCPDCDRIYWRGSHYDAMAAKLKRSGLSAG